MNNSDRLYETAFEGGELEVRNLRPSLSQSEAEELDALVTLKSDLKRLAEIPECQLTTEHLRQAVLNRKPVATPKRPNGILTWSPLVAAAALGVFLFIKGGSSVVDEGAAVRIAERNRVVKPGDVQRPLVEPTMPEASVTAPEAGNRSVASVAPTTTEPQRRRSRRSVDRSGETTVATDFVDRTASGLFTADFRTVATEPATTGPMVSEKVAGSEEEPVVVVSDHANPETGAPDAQEVSRPSDVVFGG